MSLLLDALQRSQNKSKAQASAPTDLPTLDVSPPDAPPPDAVAPTAVSQPLELTLDPMVDSTPDVARLPEPVTVPAPLLDTQVQAPVPVAPPAPVEPPKPTATPQPPASVTATAPANHLSAATAAPAPSASTMSSGTPSGSGAQPRSQAAARDAAQAMLGAAGTAHTQQPPRASGSGGRGRRLLWSLVLGLALAGLTSMGWYYWQSTQTTGLTPVTDAQPSPEASQGDVLVVQPITPDALPGEAVVAAESGAPPTTAKETKAPASAASSTTTPVVATTQTATAAPAQRVPSPTPMASAMPARQAAPDGRPAQLVRSQTQSQLQSAWSALRQGDAARAQALYQQVLASRPDDPDATLGLAVSLHRQRQLEAAWVAYQRSLQMWPDNETARTGMLAILSESDPDTAESRLQEWVQSRPRDAAAQAALGGLLGRQGRWAQALGPLTLAQSLAPDNASHAYNLAVALDQVRRYDDALQMYRFALQSGAAGVSSQALEHRIAELQEVLAR